MIKEKSKKSKKRIKIKKFIGSTKEKTVFKRNKKIKNGIKCFENENKDIIHAWNCTCDDHFWESLNGKGHKNYGQYLKHKANPYKKKL